MAARSWVAATAVLLAAGTAHAAIPLDTCELSYPGLAIRIKARCGQLEVAEDPSHPEGRRIALRVAVLSATGDHPEKDAIFFLAGGPGQAASEAWVGIAQSFERARRRRDVVLMDQRGTGGSNPLDCDLGQDPAAAKAAAARCLESLPGDPRFYTTSIAMEDLEQVRAALGYEQIDLVGVSYGTRAALTYLRRHSERVRAMVLQGVVPSQLALGLDHAKNLQRALDLQFERCAQEADCGSRFGKLREKLEALIARSEHDPPPTVEIPDPRTGQPATRTVDRMFLGAGIRFLAYAPETAALIPLLIDEADRTGKLDRLAAQSAIVSREIEGAVSAGLELSVICTEDVPFYPAALARDAETLLGDRLTQAARDECSVWPKGEMPPDFHDPVVSKVPALLISGELDPVTPPAGAEEVKRHLGRARHLVVPGQGHMMARGCMDRVLEAFLTHANPDLDARCLDEVRPPPFFVRLTGPEP